MGRLFETRPSVFGRGREARVASPVNVPPDNTWGAVADAAYSLGGAAQKGAELAFSVSKKALDEQESLERQRRSVALSQAKLNWLGRVSPELDRVMALNGVAAEGKTALFNEYMTREADASFAELASMGIPPEDIEQFRLDIGETSLRYVNQVRGSEMRTLREAEVANQNMLCAKSLEEYSKTGDDAYLFEHEKSFKQAYMALTGWTDSENMPPEYYQRLQNEKATLYTARLDNLCKEGRITAAEGYLDSIRRYLSPEQETVMEDLLKRKSYQRDVSAEAEGAFDECLIASGNPDRGFGPADMQEFEGSIAQAELVIRVRYKDDPQKADDIIRRFRQIVDASKTVWETKLGSAVSAGVAELEKLPSEAHEDFLSEIADGPLRDQLTMQSREIQEQRSKKASEEAKASALRLREHDTDYVLEQNRIIKGVRDALSSPKGQQHLSYDGKVFSLEEDGALEAYLNFHNADHVTREEVRKLVQKSTVANLDFTDEETSSILRQKWDLPEYGEQFDDYVIAATNYVVREAIGIRFENEDARQKFLNEKLQEFSKTKVRSGFLGLIGGSIQKRAEREEQYDESWQNYLEDD